MTDTSCPHCLRPYPPKFSVSGTTRRRVVDIVCQHPEGITANDVASIVYAGNSHYPVSRSIAVLIHHANKQLAQQGYTIRPTWFGRGARYHLVSIEQSTGDNACVGAS